MLSFKRLTCIMDTAESLVRQFLQNSKRNHCTVFLNFPLLFFSSWLHSDITAIRGQSAHGWLCECCSDRHICCSDLRSSLGFILAQKLSHRVLNRSWTNWDFLRQATLFGIVLLLQRPLNQVMLWVFWACEHVAVNRC